MNRLAFAVLALVSAVLAQAQWQNAEQSFLGPEVGVFMPSGSQVKNGVGDRWTTYGLGQVSLSQVAKNRKASGFNVISGSGNGSKVYLLGYTVGVNTPLGDSRRDQIIPYVTLRAGGAYMDYAVQTSPTTRLSGKKFGLTGNAEVGVVISGRISLSARYDIFTPQDGMSFDGLSLRLKYGIAGF